LITHNFNICFIYIFGIRNRFCIWNWNRDFSDNRNFLNIRSWNGNCSCNWYFFENWILNMMNIVLLIIFLHNRLSDEFFSRNLYSFSSTDIIYLNTFNNRFHHNLLIRLSVNLNIDIFSLNNRLNKSLIVNFSSRSCYSFHFWLFS